MKKKYSYSPPFNEFIGGISGLIASVIFGIAIFLGDTILTIVSIPFSIVTFLGGLASCSIYFNSNNWNYIETTSESISYPQETENSTIQTLTRFDRIDAIMKFDSYDYGIVFRVEQLYITLNKDWMNNKEFKEVRNLLLSKVQIIEDMPEIID